MYEQEFFKIREKFPILKKTINHHPFIYFDSAATAQKPKAVIDAMSRFYEDAYGTVHRAIYTTAAMATEQYQSVRKQVASFINAKSEDEIVFTRGTTQGINVVARAFGNAFVQKGDEVIITEMEHHSNIVPWQMMSQERGARLVVVPFLDDGKLDMQAYAKLLSKKTKIVAVAHISNALGTVNPIQEIVQMAHAHGAKVLVDGAQSAPHIPVDVQSLNADFFVFSGHKVVGPTGIGILYGKKELLEIMPPVEGGGDMIETVTFEKTTYTTPPVKFEAGTPMIAEVVGLGAAIDFLTKIGMQHIAAYEQELLQYLQPQMEKIPGLKVLGRQKNKSPVVTFSVEGVHPLDMATLLDLRGIAVRSGHLCAQPVMRHYNISSAARASLAFYNTKQEIDVFIKSLYEVLQTLR